MGPSPDRTADHDLAAMLDGLLSDGVPVLHERELPGTREVIDHLAVAATGVWVIETRLCRGPARVSASLTRTGEACLAVSGRGRPILLDRLNEQLVQVRRALAEQRYLDVEAHGAVCFVGTELPYRQRQVRVGDCTVTWPKALGRSLAQRGPLDEGTRDAVAQVLADAFPPSD